MFNSLNTQGLACNVAYKEKEEIIKRMTHLFSFGKEEITEKKMKIIFRYIRTNSLEKYRQCIFLMKTKILPIKIIWFVAIQIVPHFNFDVDSFDFPFVVNQVEQAC